MRPSTAPTGAASIPIHLMTNSVVTLPMCASCTMFATQPTNHYCEAQRLHEISPASLAAITLARVDSALAAVLSCVLMAAAAL